MKVFMPSPIKAYLHFILILHCIALVKPLDAPLNVTPPDQIPLSELFPPNDTGKIYITPESSIFYVLARSQTQTKAPLAVWINGGPGCSGLMGYFGEHGPYLHQNIPNAPLFAKNPHS